MSHPVPWPQDWDELRRIRSAERRGGPFLVYRDAAGRMDVAEAPPDGARTLIGRSADLPIAVTWDPRVSRVHAWIERIGGEWVVEDQGLSRNGTYVNEDRVNGRRRLRDGDVIRVGRTALLWRMPVPGVPATAPDRDDAGDLIASLSPTQRRIVMALVRPLMRPGGGAPATNETIAAEVHLSVDAVKGHLRVLYRRFAIEDLPQFQKRSRLALIVLGSGAAGPWTGGPAPPVGGDLGCG